jgi:hypothetical protein
MKYGCLSLNGMSDANLWKSSTIVLFGNELLNLAKSRSVLSIHKSLCQLWKRPMLKAMMKILCLVVQPVVPMSAPVSIYGCIGLLWSSLGKEMAHADIVMSSQ